jgi:hypothetical protein
MPASLVRGKRRGSPSPAISFRAMRHVPGSLLIAFGAAAVIALGLGASAAPASDQCGPADVVPNRVPIPAWKGGPTPVTPCGQPIVVEPQGLPTERVLTPETTAAPQAEKATVQAKKQKKVRKKKRVQRSRRR